MQIVRDFANSGFLSLRPHGTMKSSVEPVEWAKAHFFVGSEALARTMQEPVSVRIEEVARRVAEAGGLELVEVEVKGGGSQRLVRVYIDKPGGVTHGDCELVSREMGTILDSEDIVPGGRYTLEVSSPGIERKLSKPQDYQRFQGQKIRATLREPVGNSRHWEGRLAGYSGDLIRLETDSGSSVEFRFDQVQKANLKYDW